MQPTSRSITVIVVAVCALVLASCGSSGSSKASTTTGSTAAVSATGNPTTVAATAAAPTTAPSSPSSTAGSGASSGSPTLVLPLCGLLDRATVVRVVGAAAGTCQNFAPESEAGRCLWGTLGPSARTVQLTAFTGARLVTRKIGWKAAFKPVSGVGRGAWSNGAITIGADKNVVVYVDYGTFGIEFAVSAPNADIAMAVTLGQSIK